jgi:hypothetical protein
MEVQQWPRTVRGQLRVSAKKYVGTLSRLGGLALLAALAYYTVDFATFLSTLSNATPATLALLLAVATADRFVMAAKWWQLCRAIGIRTPYREFVKIYYGASFLSYAMPSTIGAELYRGYQLSRRADPHGVVASMLMEKAIAVGATIGLAWAGLLVLVLEFGSARTSTALQLLLAASCLALLALALSLYPRTHDTMLWLPRRLGFAKTLEKLSTSYAQFGRHPRALAGNFALSLVENAIQLALVYGAGVCLAVEASPHAFLAIVAVSQFVRRASMVLDGWGLATALHILLFGLIGIDASQALAISLLSHAVTAAACLVPGGLVLALDRAPRELPGEAAVHR